MKFRKLVSGVLMAMACKTAIAANWYGLTELVVQDMDQYPVGEPGGEANQERSRIFVSGSDHDLTIPGGSIGVSAYVEYERSLIDGSEAARSSLTELYLSQSPGDAIYLDIGKKKQITGTGFFRSPSDFFYPNVNEIDRRLGSTFDEKREGLIGLGVTYLGEHIEVSNYFSPRVSSPDQSLWDKHLGLTQRFEQNQLKVTLRLSDIDTSFLYHTSRAEEAETIEKFALNFVSLLTHSIEIHGDAVLIERDTRLTFSNEGISQEDVDWFSQVTLGLSWTMSNNFNLIAEYYYNQYGLHEEAFDALLAYDFSETSNFSLANDPRLSYGVFNTARSYLMGQLSYQTDLSVLEIKLFNLHNLVDGSGLVTLDFAKRLTGKLTVLSNFGIFYGGDRSEARLLRERGRALIAVQMYF